jgi:TonB-dependent SusC/RagA subfamily outer membrane receptor
VQNALQALQGKAAGIDITSSERPGEIGKVLIRGVRSLNASSDPLYVVDGIPLNVGTISAVNPNDIETIDVLKDASATAIYGSRGANGVVLITTKKGKNGALNLDKEPYADDEFSPIHRFPPRCIQKGEVPESACTSQQYLSR